MANITTCPRCGILYEAGSEEQANETDRLCWRCARPDPEPEPPCPNHGYSNCDC